MNGVELARTLGVHHSAISRLRAGKQAQGRAGLSFRFVEAAVIRFPELALFLPPEMRTIIDSVREGTDGEEGQGQ